LKGKNNPPPGLNVGMGGPSSHRGKRTRGNESRMENIGPSQPDLSWVKSEKKEKKKKKKKRKKKKKKKKKSDSPSSSEGEGEG